MLQPAVTNNTTTNTTGSTTSNTTSNTTPNTANVSQQNVPAAAVVVAQVQATLNKQLKWTDGKGWGQFNYRILWRLAQGVPFRTLIVQKVTVTYEVQDENGNDIPDIATFTNN
jgi:hypothetical protein